MKNLVLFLILIFCFNILLPVNSLSEENMKLDFLVGEWESTSRKLNDGKASTGYSSVKWIVGGTWLQWKFKTKTEKGLLEVLTLINFNKEKKQYAFYSFNPFETEPLPHFGNWAAPNNLRLKIITPKERTCIDFIIKENGNFDQIHSRLTSSGKKIPLRKTNYTRIAGKKNTTKSKSHYD